jgi:outer membrane biogenesis lipoprotein LolB
MNSIALNPDSRRLHRIVPWLLIALFFFSGCAGKPWTGALPEEEYARVAEELEDIHRRDTVCPTSFTGDLALFYRTPLQSHAVKGYLQFSMPNAYRFVVTNPLGQPLLMIAGNQSSYQAINTFEKKYLAGSVRSYAIRRGIPLYLTEGQWGDWLTGRYSGSSGEIAELRQDRADRGVWVSFTGDAEKNNPIQRLLFDRQRGLILTRILEDGRGNSLAEISYSDWLSQDGCHQPQHIAISGLDFGVEISLQLDNLFFSDAAEIFELPIPRGYLRQYLP